MTTTAGSIADASESSDSARDPLPLTPRQRFWFGNLAFVLLAYVPLFFMDPGKVDADTKTYLYLDPGRFLAGASSMWDPHVGMGTVPHQTLGYLFPMGPFYWLLEQGLGSPAWVAQRLWLGSLLCGAGLGVGYLLRTLKVRGPGVPVAMLAYAFTPYAIEYSSRLSVLLGPWSALPWLTAFTILSLRHRGWKYPALFALTIQLVSSINATALIFALVGPALWYPYAIWVLKEIRFRDALSVALRTTLLTILTSLWWIVGLSIQGQYGLDVLRFTETLPTVSATAYPFEILRGLGYWFFYGRDRTGLWNDALTDFTQSPGTIFVSFVIPTLGIAAAALVRWRHRAYYVILLVVGLTIGVAAAPYNSPSPLGAIFKRFALSSTAGFALRSTSRAVPLIILAFAVFLAVAINALGTRLRTQGKIFGGVIIAVVVGVLVMLNAPGALAGKYYSKYLERNENVPAYWTAATSALDAQSHTTRVLGLPGSDFAAYTWGDTIDPIEPGLMSRDYIARELVPWGSEPAANLLQALDRRIQEGDFEPSSLAPVARLMGVGDVLLRMDLQTDRFGLIPSHQLWQDFTKPGVPPGLGPYTTYGTKIPGQLQEPEVENPARPTTPAPPPVAVFPVDDAQAMVTAKSTDAPLVIDGDGEGLMDVSAAGLLDANRAVLYSASYEQDPAKLQAVAPNAILVLTDSNRRRALRWSGIVGNYGYTEVAGEKPVADPTDQRLDVFPGSDDNAKTVDVMRGIKSISATSYGTNTFGYTPTQRPAEAFDGDPDTAWVADPGIETKHQVLSATLDQPITTGQITLAQPAGDPSTRWVSQVTVTFDHKTSVKLDLNPTSRTDAGQTLTFPRRTFSQISLRVDAVHELPGLAIVNKNPIGFTEVKLRDDAPGSPYLRVDETMQMPKDMLSSFGTSSLQHPLAIVLTAESTMDQVAMNRQFQLPTARSFTLSGTAIVGAHAPDNLIDQAFGIPSAAQGGVTATSTERLADPIADPIARASSAIDGDPSTAWNSPIGEVRNARVTVKTSGSISVDHLALQVVADNRHSIPTSIAITNEAGTKRVVSLPSIKDNVGGKGVATVDLDFAPLTGKSFTFSFPTVRQVKRSDLLMPIGIAEFGIPGVERAAPPSVLPATCQADLITIDGKPFPVRISGTTADAQNERKLTLAPCNANQVVTLGPGTHQVRVRMTPYTGGAFDVNRLVLSSAAGGQPVAMTSLESGTQPTTMPVTLTDQTDTSMKVHVTPTSSSPFWLVLGQSLNKGWVAKVNGHSLGVPQLIDGYANGWMVPARANSGPVTISVEWTPQRKVFDAILISAIATAACLAILVVAAVRKRRRRRSPAFEGAAEYEEPAATIRRMPWTETLRPGRRTIILTILVSGALAALLVQPLIGLLLAVVVFFALRGPKWRTVLVTAPAVVLAVITIYITFGQLFGHYPPRFDWPTFFAIARLPAWFAVLMLGADALMAKDWRAGTGPGDDDG